MGVDSLGVAMVLAYEFKMYRLHNGLEPEHLAVALGVSVETIKQIENCTVKASVFTKERFRASSMQDDASNRAADEFIKLVETSLADMLLFDPHDNLIATSKFDTVVDRTVAATLGFACMPICSRGALPTREANSPARYGDSRATLLNEVKIVQILSVILFWGRLGFGDSWLNWPFLSHIPRSCIGRYRPYTGKSSIIFVSMF